MTGLELSRAFFRDAVGIPAFGAGSIDEKAAVLDAKSTEFIDACTKTSHAIAACALAAPDLEVLAACDR